MALSFSLDDDRAAEKAELRAHFRALRAAVPAPAVAVRDAQVRDTLRKLPEARKARSIYAFWPLVARGEIDLRPLLVEWHRSGKTIALPRVEGFAPPRLAFHVWQPDDARVTTGWGVDEPHHDAPPAPAPDLIVVPALAVDEAGFRLGYGGGFYDAFLAAHSSTPTAVPLLDEMRADVLPRDPHDVPVHLVVTDMQTLRFPSSAQP